MECARWLKEYLDREGCVLWTEVRNAAKRAGYSKKDLKVARELIGVKTYHQFDEGKDTENWFWYLEG